MRVLNHNVLQRNAIAGFIENTFTLLCIFGMHEPAQCHGSYVNVYIQYHWAVPMQEVVYPLCWKVERVEVDSG